MLWPVLLVKLNLQFIDLKMQNDEICHRIISSHNSCFCVVNNSRDEIQSWLWFQRQRSINSGCKLLSFLGNINPHPSKKTNRLNIFCSISEYKLSMWAERALFFGTWFSGLRAPRCTLTAKASVLEEDPTQFVFIPIETYELRNINFNHVQYGSRPRSSHLFSWAERI